MSFGSSGFVIKVYSLLHNKLISCFFCKVLFFYFVLVFRFLHFVSYILFLTNFISFFLGLGSSLQLRYIFYFSIFFITLLITCTFRSLLTLLHFYFTGFAFYLVPFIFFIVFILFILFFISFSSL